MSEKTFEPTRGAHFTLFNRFAELMLVVGLDENTGLVSLRKDTDSSSEEVDYPFSSLFNDEYEAQVIAAISASKALVFQPNLMEDPAYPPSAESMGTMRMFQNLKSKSEKQTPQRNTRKTSVHRMALVNPSVPKHLNIKEHSSTTSTSVSDLPLSMDAIEGITTFCFPDNAHVYPDKPDNSIHFLVLTDMSGSKTYASCLTFYRPYVLTRTQEGSIKFIINTNGTRSTNEDSHVLCYIPQCCVLVSKYPYFYAMKECLSCMINHVERDMEEMYQFLKEFTYTMTMTPVPPAGDVIVEMSICNLSVPLIPSESPEKPVIDLPLHLAFLCFPVDELLKIFTAILCEEKLVFVSYNYALLTTVMESFLYFILPFSWRFTYVPILSSSSLELLDAPGTFMMGCHSKHLDDVLKVSGLFVVNIDEGIVIVNTQQQLSQPNLSLSPDSRNNFTLVDNNSIFPSLPVEPANIFKNIFKKAEFQLELSDVQRPFYYNIEEERALRMKKSLQFNTEIGFVFLEMMVNLFRGAVSYLRIEHQHFNKPQFMESVAECDRPFYEKVLKTDMFKQFLEDRLKGKMDYWSDHEKKTHTFTKRTNGPLPSPMGISQRHKQRIFKQVPITTFYTMPKRVCEVFRLPTLNNSVSYVKNTILQLNKSIEKCESIHKRSSYIYLRGMFHAAEGNVDNALSDLLSLHAHNARLLPMGFVHKLLQLIPDTDREDMLRKRGITDIRDPGPGRPTLRPKFMGEVPIPDCDLSLEVFVQTISLLEMATDFDTIQRLFLVLANPDKPTHVDKYTFDVFRLCYDENLAQCDALVLPDNNSKVKEDVILKVSGLIKTDFGMGRIVLTDKRLFFIKDVSNEYREIVKLRNIARVEKVQYYTTLLRPVDALIIEIVNNKDKFKAWLKTERNSWVTLIEEMKAGKIVAEATKDFTAIGHAVQNVLLIDAVIISGHDEAVAHYGQVSHSAETLCFFTSYMTEGKHILPQDTTSALQNRVDPNIGQRDRKTVIIMLYTAGRSNNNIPPRLWCGMGDGRVRVFDATNWALEESFIQTKNTVAALIAVGDCQVWAGSHGISIIDTETITCNKTLTEHPDLVVDIVLTHQGRYAYSASVDATIIQWELQTLQCVRRIPLSNVKYLRNMKLYDGQLWCGTWKDIRAMNFEGVTLKTFSYSPIYEDSDRIMELSCFEVFNNEIWAGSRREGEVVVWNVATTERKIVLQPTCSGVSALLVFGDKVWVGTKDGIIYIYNVEDKQLCKTIRAHDDAVRSLCAAQSRYIMSGSGSKDGKIAVWNPNIGLHDTET